MTLAAPRRRESPDPKPIEWLLGEALTNLYVGLGRFRRGEKLSAARFVQQYALDRVLELVAQAGEEVPGYGDAFAPERRFDVYPAMAQAIRDVWR
jgi:hypothetical protein